MTDAQIMKALRCLQKENPNPLDRMSCYFMWKPQSCFNCYHTVAKEALDLIKRQKAEIDRLNDELMAMRGAANSYKAEYKKLQEAEAKRLQEMVTPLVIRSNKIPAQELAEMIKIGVISTDIEGAEIERLRENNKAIMQTMADVHTEAIKEFAERLKKETTTAISCNTFTEIVRKADIDNLVKEMVGATDEQKQTNI